MLLVERPAAAISPPAASDGRRVLQLQLKLQLQLLELLQLSVGTCTRHGGKTANAYEKGFSSELESAPQQETAADESWRQTNVDLLSFAGGFEI